MTPAAKTARARKEAAFAAALEGGAAPREASLDAAAAANKQQHGDGELA